MEIQELKQKMTACQDERQNLKFTADYFRMRADKYEVLGKLPQTENVFFISGYVPQEKAQAVADDLVQNFEAMAELEEVSEKEEPPVLLKIINSHSQQKACLLRSGCRAKERWIRRW